MHAMPLPFSYTVKVGVYSMDFHSDDSTQCPFAFEHQSLYRSDVDSKLSFSTWDTFSCIGEWELQLFSAGFSPYMRLSLFSTCVSTVACTCLRCLYVALINLITGQHAHGERKGMTDNLETRFLDATLFAFPLWSIALRPLSQTLITVIHAPTHITPNTLPTNTHIHTNGLMYSAPAASL